MMTRIQVWWLFYRSIAPAGIFISLSCALAYWCRKDAGDVVEGIAITKMISNAAIFFSLRFFDLRRPVFFYNLHYSPGQLWTAAFVMDTTILLLLLLIAKQL